MSSNDHYSVLGVDNKSSPDEIRKAFRKKAVEHHPDKGGNEEMFKKINEAYNTLSDPRKRNQYDNRNNQFHPDSFMNMFFKHSQNMNNVSPKAREVRETVIVTLNEAYKGCKKTVTIVTNKPCSECAVKCTKCSGVGMVEERVEQIMGHAKFVQMAKVSCKDCKGKGKTINKIQCDKCKNKRHFENKSFLNIQLPPKTFHDYISRIKHPDEEDLFVVIKVVVKFPPGFHKSGDNLCYNHRIDLVDTFLGTKIEIHHPSGEKIEIDYTKKTDIIRPDTVLRIDGKGVLPNTELVVKFDVLYPSKRRLCSLENQDTFTSVRDNLKQIFTR